MTWNRTMRDIKLIKVSAHGNVPVFLNGLLVPTDSPIWEVGNDNGPDIYIPAVFLLNSQNNFLLRFHFEIPPILQDKSLKLKGMYIFDESNQKELFETITDIPDNEDRKPGSVLVGMKKIDSFKLISGKDISWVLNIDEDQDDLWSKKIDMELYWIYDFKKEYFPRGVPIRIIREIAASASRANWKLMNVDFDDDVIRPQIPVSKFTKSRDMIIYAIVLHIFLRNPPSYNVGGIKGTKFYHFEKHRGGEDYNVINLHLNEYLCSKFDPIATCDCIAMAAVLQYFLRCVGFYDVMIRRMDGVSIKFSRIGIIGRGWSNSPLYEETHTTPLVDPSKEKQSEIKRHVFCTSKDTDNSDAEYILDSCFGPSTGDWDFEEYKKNIISKESSVVHYCKDEFIGVIATNRLSKVPLQESDFKIGEYIEKISNRESELYYLMTSILNISSDENKYVVCDWPPRWLKKIMRRNRWVKFCETIIPGYGEVQYILKFYRNYERIEIKVNVSSIGNNITYFRYFHGVEISLGMEEQLDENGRSFEFSEEKFSDTSNFKNRWCKDIPIGNVMIRIECYNLLTDIDYLKENLQKYAKDNILKKDALKDHLPCKPGFSIQSGKSGGSADFMGIEMGDLLEVKSNGSGDNFMDFYIEDVDSSWQLDNPFAEKGLQLIKENDSELVFKATEFVSRTKRLTVTVINKKTLLCNSNSILFRVVKE